MFPRCTPLKNSKLNLIKGDLLEVVNNIYLRNIGGGIKEKWFRAGCEYAKKKKNVSKVYGCVKSHKREHSY